MLETMRRRIRSLVKLIEKTKRSIVYTDFEDELGELSAASLRGMEIGTDRTRFEQKLRIFLRAHEDQLAIQKIRRNKQITATDLTELERIFIEASIGSEADIDQAKAESGGLGLFLRSLTGLEREAAAMAFSTFQAGKTLTSAQLRFVNQLIEYLARNGTIDVAGLYESPFSSLAPGGPETLFPEADVVAMIAVIHSIRETATTRQQTG
ncbi:type I restriction-modification enzyme R subunit C-terminal domain-containing protein [Streptomyces sp. NPDC057580]|uniref:type I restriction-modification enzyme R subunit C-terminal domain-containing protein n=1 Tax=Streptomyces sp. NPDC057580 TaxID=3346173 RepID=UPI0036C48A9E